jgi:hypothetical protein
MIIAVHIHIHMHISPFAFTTDYTTIGACAQGRFWTFLEQGTRFISPPIEAGYFSRKWFISPPTEAGDFSRKWLKPVL